MLGKQLRQFFEQAKAGLNQQKYSLNYDSLYYKLYPYDSLIALVPLAYRIAPIPYALICVETVVAFAYAITAQQNCLSNVIVGLIAVLALTTAYTQIGRKVLGTKLSQEVIDPAFHQMVEGLAMCMTFLQEARVPQGVVQTIKAFGILFFALLVSKVLDVRAMLFIAHGAFHLCAWFDFFIKDENYIDKQKFMDYTKRAADALKEKTIELKEKGTELLNKAKASAKSSENNSAAPATKKEDTAGAEQQQAVNAVQEDAAAEIDTVD